MSPGQLCSGITSAKALNRIAGARKCPFVLVFASTFQTVFCYSRNLILHHFGSVQVFHLILVRFVSVCLGGAFLMKVTWPTFSPLMALRFLVILSAKLIWPSMEPFQL